VATATPHTWACPSCGRRVPLRAGACHCGMTRERAEAVQVAEAAQVQRAADPPVRRRPSFVSARDRQEAVAAMTTDVKLLLAGCAVALVAGLGFMAFGPRPAPVPAVLGYVDAPPPPQATPPPEPKPPFKLPWWK
jgi:hypothetical protein